MILRISIYMIFLALGTSLSGQDGLAKNDVNDPAQKLATGTDSFKKRYERNIKKSRINGVYIPADLKEAFEELNALSEGEGVVKFKSAPEHVIANKLHFGLGRWISINWNLEEGSRYGHYLRELGIVDVDDQIQFTIVSWHRDLLGKEQQIEERVKKYQEELAEKLNARMEKSEVLHSEKKKIEKD